MRFPQFSRLAGAAGLGLLLVGSPLPAPAQIPFHVPAPVATPVEVTTYMLTSLQATYVAQCLAPLFGDVLPPYVEKACVVLELLVDGLQQEQAKLCAAAPAAPACQPERGVSAPWRERVE